MQFVAGLVNENSALEYNVTGLGFVRRRSR